MLKVDKTGFASVERMTILVGEITNRMPCSVPPGFESTSARPASVNLVGDRKLIGLRTTRAAAVLRNVDVAIPVGEQPVNLIGHRRQGRRDRASHISAEDRDVAEGYARRTSPLVAPALRM